MFTQWEKTDIITEARTRDEGGLVMEYKVTYETTMGEVLAMNPAVANILLEVGMHCIGCPAHQSESLAEAAMVHGLDPELLIEKINAFLNA